jgi:hypothetical protein
MGVAIAPQIILAAATIAGASVGAFASVILVRSGQKHEFRIKHEDARLELALDYQRALTKARKEFRIGDLPGTWFDEERYLLVQRCRLLFEQDIVDVIDAVEDALRLFWGALLVLDGGLNPDAQTAVDDWQAKDDAYKRLEADLHGRLNARFSGRPSPGKLNRAARWLRRLVVSENKPST